MKYTKEDLKAGMVFQVNSEFNPKDKGYVIIDPCASPRGTVNFDSLDSGSIWRDNTSYTVQKVLDYLNTGSWIITDDLSSKNPSYEIF